QFFPANRIGLESVWNNWRSIVMIATVEKSPRGVLFFCAVCLLLIFGASFWYRLSHPGLTVERVSPDSQTGMMSGLGEYMERLQEDPDDVQALMYVGRAFLQMGAWDRAAEFFSRLARVEPENASAHYFLGMSRFQLQEYEKAATRFEQVLALDHEDELSHFNLGILYKHFLDQPLKAEEHFKKVLELEPENEEIVAQAREELESPHDHSSGN
ncbi:MAG: tetratricopeptide repeat protein, partial [Desulfovibrionales bacterium]